MIKRGQGSDHKHRTENKEGFVVTVFFLCEDLELQESVL
jgi:hypothetical protein